MKQFKYFLFAFVAMFIAMSFASCGDDSEDNEDSATDVKTSKFYYAFSVSDDLLSLANVTINYIDTDGQEYSEQMTTTTWSKTLTANKLDVSTGVQMIVEMKEDVQLTKEKYDICRNFSYQVTPVVNGKEVDGAVQSVNFDHKGVVADKVEELIDRLSATRAYYIDAKGNVTTTTLSWKSNSMKYNNDFKVEE